VTLDNGSSTKTKLNLVQILQFWFVCGWSLQILVTLQTRNVHQTCKKYPASADFHYPSSTNWNTVLATSVLGLYPNSPVALNILKATGHMMHHQFNIQQLYALLTLTVFMCFVFILEQTATCATYSINWLVFITAMKSVYSAVRTGSLNEAVCASSVKG
jgi:hypothetical protein